MKFARYLEENVVVEWRKAYINYRGLKKVIKRVDARRKIRLSKDLSRSPSKSSSKRSFAPALDGLRKRSAARDAGYDDDGENDHSYLATGRRRRSYGGIGNGASLNDDDEEEDDHLPRVTLDGTGLALASHDNIRKRGGGVGSDITRFSSGEDDLHTSHPRQDSDVEANALHIPSSRSGSINYKSGSLDGEDPHTLEEANGTSKKKKKKKRKTDKVIDLETIVDQNFDKQERRFFGALDNELERIVAFYEARESDMATRYEMLARQLRELSDHRKEYKASHTPQEGWTDVGNRLNHLVHQSVIQPAQAHTSGTRTSRSGAQSQMADNKAGTDTKIDSGGFVDEGDKRRSIALSKMLNSGGGTLTEAEDEEVRRLNKDAAMSHDPERYRAARKKLKAVVLEYYRGLEILKNYKVLNRTGFAKILKKFEKTTAVHCADAYYNAKVASSVLVSSESVEKLLKSTEDVFAAYFEHGDRKKAVQRLRINASGGTGENTSTHHQSVARAGFYLGITLCATVGGITNALHPDTQLQIPLWQSLMRVYGAELLPVLFALLFGLNLAIWHRARVNSVFIFEWDVRHALDYHQYFELPAFLLLLLSLAFWVSFLNPFPDAIAPTTWPLVWLVVVLIILLNPLPFTQYYSRRWIVISLARVFQGGLWYTVEFRDFFLGDELNSLNWSMSMLWFFGCEYNSKWSYPDQCNPNQTFWTPVLLAIPAFLRLLQCFRRFKDSKSTARLHLINAGKYTSSIFYYFFYFNYRYHGSQRTKDLALWCVFGTIYSIYTSTWDITMDWSLLRRHARYPWLRDELVFESYWPFYYWAIVTNIILRFGWIIYLLPGPASSLMRIFVIALLEALRRIQWNILRLENEHLGNVDMFRISKDIPLPYNMRGGDRSKEDEETEEDEVKKPAFGPKALLKLKTAVMGRYYSNSASQINHGPGYDASTQPPFPTKGGWDEEEEVAINEGSRKASLSQMTDKGKQRVSSGEEDEESTPSKIKRRIRDHLVPDRGGLASIGSRLDDMGVAKGANARDYEPRSLDRENTRSSDLDTSDDEDGDHRIEKDAIKQQTIK